MSAPDPKPAKLARQQKLVAVLGAGLIIAGLLLLFLLHRLAVPLRLMAGLGDIFMGAVLLVLVWQQRGKRE